MTTVLNWLKSHLWLVLAAVLVSLLVRPLVEKALALWLGLALLAASFFVAPWLALSALSVLVNAYAGGILKRLG